MVLSIVNSSVYFKLLWGEEWFITIFTRKSVFTHMNSLFMLYHLSLSCVTFTTSCTQETFSRMNTHMNLQLIFSYECLFTNISNMWFDAKMYFFCVDLTFSSSWFCVHTNCTGNFSFGSSEFSSISNIIYIISETKVNSKYNQIISIISI